MVDEVLKYFSSRIPHRNPLNIQSEKVAKTNGIWKDQLVELSNSSTRVLGDTFHKSSLFDSPST